MKKILFLLAACFVFVACGMKSKTEGTVLPADKETTVRPDGVEVLCFHSKQRCATCIAIEKMQGQQLTVLLQTDWQTVH